MTPQLIHRLSFTHLSELIQLPDDTQRRFYEIECIRSNWSVRELRRQIDSLYYQRSGLSKNKAKLSATAHAKAETLQPAQIIRDPYIFEFLGRYYYTLNPAATASYVYAYRTMWDSEDVEAAWR